jgi:hypothetical protein
MYRLPAHRDLLTVGEFCHDTPVAPEAAFYEMHINDKRTVQTEKHIRIEPLLQVFLANSLHHADAVLKIYINVKIVGPDIRYLGDCYLLHFFQRRET